MLAGISFEPQDVPTLSQPPKVAHMFLDLRNMRVSKQGTIRQLDSLPKPELVVCGFLVEAKQSQGSTDAPVIRFSEPHALMIGRLP